MNLVCIRMLQGVMRQAAGKVPKLAHAPSSEYDAEDIR